jgi:hypothetical protein
VGIDGAGIDGGDDRQVEEIGSRLAVSTALVGYVAPGSRTGGRRPEAYDVTWPHNGCRTVPRPVPASRRDGGERSWPRGAVHPLTEAHDEAVSVKELATRCAVDPDALDRVWPIRFAEPRSASETVRRATLELGVDLATVT